MDHSQYTIYPPTITDLIVTPVSTLTPAPTQRPITESHLRALVEGHFHVAPGGVVMFHESDTIPVDQAYRAEWLLTVLASVVLSENP